MFKYGVFHETAQEEAESKVLSEDLWKGEMEMWRWGGRKKQGWGEGNDKRMSGDKIRCSEGDDIEKEKRGR